ncbi:PAH domain-containing protein, partial [Cephalotus follicularis]
TTSKVRSYLSEVKAGLEDDNKYPMFCSIMVDFIYKRVDLAGVAARVNEMFKGHQDLIMGFNDFLPKKHKIDIHPKYQEAVDFTKKVWLQFHDKEHICNAFLDVLKLYKEGKMGTHEVYYEADFLFKGHDDLVQEFGRLLLVDPFGVASCDKQEEKAWDKKYKGGLDLWREDLLRGFNYFLPKKHKIAHDPKYPETLDFSEKVRLQFHDKENICNAFFDALKLYEEGKRGTHEVYYEVESLFKGHDDLFQEFGRLLAVDGFGVGSCDKQGEKPWDKMYKRGLDICGKVDNELGNSYDYLTFCKGLHWYTTQVIDWSELQVLVANLLPQDSGLIEEFNSFLNYCENIDGACVESVGSRSSSSDADSVQDVHLINPEDCTPSNYLGPEKAKNTGNSYDYLTFLKSLHLYTTKVIGSSELQVLVANLLPQDSGLMDEFNSFLNYCENIDGSSVASDGSGSSSSEENTGKHQEMLFQCEDIRFVRDLLLHSVSSATMQADESVSRIKDSNSITLETPVEVKEHFTCLNSRCIERLCGPALTLPVILSRLMQKREDLTRLMTEFNELWAQVNAKNPKENSKRLITKSLKRRIRRIEERMQTEHDIFL